MKIIVSSELEKGLVKRFLTAMRDLDMVDELAKSDTECETEYLESDDQYFIEDMISNAKIEIDEKVQPLYIENYHITGTCTKCGTFTEGTVDGEDISYDDWMDQTSEEAQKTWLCEDCMNREANDGR
jgi:hypothetical protein